MEKQRTDFFTVFCRRLLAFAVLPLILAQTGMAQGKNESGILPLTSAKLLVTGAAEGKPLYTNTDIEFKILLPGKSASDISVIEPQTDRLENATLRAIKKSGDSELKATWIQVWFMFEKAGSYTLPDLLLRTGDDIRSLSFETVRIMENPLDKLPRIVLTFSDGSRLYSDRGDFSGKEEPVISAVTGRALSFTVYLQYAAELHSFDWSLPKNAIFTRTKDYLETGAGTEPGTGAARAARKSAGSPDSLVPVAEFSWEALEAGIQTMPRMRMSVTANNGMKNDVIFPEFSVRFSTGKSSSASEKEREFFTDAFSTEQAAGIGSADSTGSAGASTAHRQITKEDCQRLAELYRAESKAILFPGKKRTQRMRLEEELGITPWLKQRLYLGDYGISTGCRIFSIPEEGAAETAFIAGGNSLKIKESTDGWLLVRFGETEGWCKKDEVIVWTWATF